MSVTFQIQNSDPALLARATAIARAFVQDYMRPDVVGIVLLGAIPRGYFDTHADIDIAIFQQRGAELPLKEKFLHIDGLEVQIWLSDYEDDHDTAWDMARRWTYTQREIVHDPQGKIAQLLAEKVPLRPEERRWMLMAGLTLSEWYVNRLTQLWVDRGSLTSAQHMFEQGINYFYELLFALNHELVADTKWRLYCVERLERLPSRFQERIREAMLLHAFTMEDVGRRKQAFMGMWDEMKPLVEAETGMTFEEMLAII